MKNQYNILLLLFIFVGYIVTITASPREKLWLSFTSSPDSINYIKCSDQIKIDLEKLEEAVKSDKLSTLSTVEKTTTFTQLIDGGILGSFLEKVENGNEYASNLCFQLWPLFWYHAPIIEEFTISYGKMLKNDPVLFLEVIRKYSYTSKEKIDFLASFVGAYGEEFVDEFEKKIQETDIRIKILKNVKEKNLIEARDLCIELLNSRKKEILEVLELEKK